MSNAQREVPDWPQPLLLRVIDRCCASCGSGENEHPPDVRGFFVFLARRPGTGAGTIRRIVGSPYRIAAMRTNNNHGAIRALRAKVQATALLTSLYFYCITIYYVFLLSCFRQLPCDNLQVALHNGRCREGRDRKGAVWWGDLDCVQLRANGVHAEARCSTPPSRAMGENAICRRRHQSGTYLS